MIFLELTNLRSVPAYIGPNISVTPHMASQKKIWDQTKMFTAQKSKMAAKIGRFTAGLKK